jgi:pilus assembly protein CpaB
MAAGVNAERTNRWLLIGAAVLAVLAGVLVFALLANVGGGDDKTSSASDGDTQVLVAKQTINPGTEVTEDMFELVNFDSKYVVQDAVDDPKALVGQTASTKILEGAQISTQQFVGGASDTFDKQLTFKVPDGMRAYSMSVGEETAVGGLLVPSDRVDIIVRYTTKASPSAQFRDLHIEVFAENVEVLARAQTDVEGVSVLDPEANPTETAATTNDEGVVRRPEEIDADPGAATITLALTPQQVLELGKYAILDDGEVSIALRKFGDDAPSGTTPVIIPLIDDNAR